MSRLIAVSAGTALLALAAAACSGFPSGGGGAKSSPTQLTSPAASKSILAPLFSPCLPESLPTPGINSSPVQVGPGPSDLFTTVNQWTGPVTGSPGTQFIVWAGKTGAGSASPNVPALTVAARTLGSDGCSTRTTMIGTFSAPQAGAALSIVSVSGNAVALVSQSGMRISFDLVGHVFSSG